MNKEQPLYMYRPSDFSIYHRVDENGYVHRDNIGKKDCGNRHRYDTLIFAGFIPCEESDFEELDKKRDEHMNFRKWYNRSDGHGGIKGGTMEEYLKYLEK